MVPTSTGLIVIAVLVATSAPLTNNFPVSPAMVTATWVQAPTVSGVLLSCCSPPPFLMVKRRVPSPDLGQRNKLRAVPSPRSKTRCQLPPPFHFTQPEKLKSVLSPTRGGSRR